MSELTLNNGRFTKVLILDFIEFDANHEYAIVPINDDSTILANVSFQKGPIKENGVNGCHHEDLLTIVLHRLNAFQKSKYACRENALAITKIEEALHWLDHRTRGRQERDVEGTSAT